MVRDGSRREGFSSSYFTVKGTMAGWSGSWPGRWRASPIALGSFVLEAVFASPSSTPPIAQLPKYAGHSPLTWLAFIVPVAVHVAVLLPLGLIDHTSRELLEINRRGHGSFLYRERRPPTSA